MEIFGEKTSWSPSPKWTVVPRWHNLSLRDVCPQCLIAEFVTSTLGCSPGMGEIESFFVRLLRRNFLPRYNNQILNIGKMDAPQKINPIVLANLRLLWHFTLAILMSFRVDILLSINREYTIIFQRWRNSQNRIFQKRTSPMRSCRACNQTRPLMQIRDHSTDVLWVYIFMHTHEHTEKRGAKSRLQIKIGYWTGP